METGFAPSEIDTTTPHPGPGVRFPTRRMLPLSTLQGGLVPV